jgi:sterol 3beta-glucosyltransferase
MKTITILCGGGSRGDVQPYLALGVGLHDAGYRVRIVGDMEFEAMVMAHGLDFVSTHIATRAFVEEHVAGMIHEKNPFKKMRRLQKMLPLLNANERQQADAQWKACQGSDAVMGHMLHDVFGISIAQKLGVPYFEAEVKPIIPTHAYAPMVYPVGSLGGGLNYAAHQFTEYSLWLMQRGSINKWRVALLSQPRLPMFNYYARIKRGIALRLVGISPCVIPRPADWGDEVHLTGWWTLHEAQQYQPPADLAAFLEAGSPPVYIGFGSMPSADPAATTALIVKALALAGQRGILIGGWGGLAKTDLPDFAFHIDSVPHDWLFPRTAAVAHHGGAGTTAAGLRAGVPSIVIPHIGDQPFWGRRVEALGSGPKPIPRSKLTPERLADAIRTAITDQPMRDRAAMLGEKIRAEDGVRNAVEVIKGCL